MKTTPLSDTLTQLTRLRFVNAYLVREDDGLTLVNTTISRGGDALLAAAEQTGAPIRRIALTHGHGDHVGSVDELKAKLGHEVQVLMGELDARIHAGEKVVEGKLTGSWPKLATAPDVRLQPGDRVGSLEVVPTPGHSPGHVAFLDTRDRTLIAGDVFTSLGGVAVSNHFYLRFSAGRDGDLRQGPRSAVGPRAACARPHAARRRARPSRARAGHRDGRGDRAGGRLIPRRRLGGPTINRCQKSW